MFFGKNNDEYLTVDYSPSNGYMVEVENAKTNDMVVSVVEPAEINMSAEQVSKNRIIKHEKFSMFFDGNIKQFVIELFGDITIKEAVNIANTFRYEDREKDAMRLYRAIEGEFKKYINTVKIDVNRVLNSVNIAGEYTVSPYMEIPVGYIKRDVLDSIKIPSQKDWVKINERDKVMCVMVFGKYAKLAIIGEGVGDEVHWYGSFASSLLKKAELARAVEVEVKVGGKSA